MEPNSGQQGVDSQMPPALAPTPAQSGSPTIPLPAPPQLGGQAAQPQAPQTPQDSQATQVSQTPQASSQQQPPSATTVQPPRLPGLNDDADLIEKEWVDKAKHIVETTRDNPHKQSEELTKVRADYIQKRYGKTTKVDQ